MAATFYTAVVTPEAAVLEADLSSAQVPAHDGLVGILPQRAPLLTKLGVGVLRLTTPQGVEQKFFVSGGYAQMKDNTLTILTDEAIPAKDITRQLIDAAQAKADALTGTDEATLAKKSQAQARVAVLRQLGA